MGLTVHTWSFFLSLPAAYAVFGDKFVLPSLERADKVCAKLRGKLATHLQEELERLAGRDDRPITATVLYDADNEPAQISQSLRFGGQFEGALRRFLDNQSDDFCRYHSAMRLQRMMYYCWSGIRIFAAFWPVLALIGIVTFGAFSKEIVSMPTQPWLWAWGGILAIPLIVLLLHLPALALVTKRLESLEP